MVIALVTVSPTGSGAVPKSNSQTQLQKMINLQSGFELAIRSLSRSVEFFSQNYEKVNLDAIYGLRVAEGEELKMDNMAKTTGHLSTTDHLRRFPYLLF